MFKRGTLLVRKPITCYNAAVANVIVDVHDDMLKDKYWNDNSYLLMDKPKDVPFYIGSTTTLLQEQLDIRKCKEVVE